MAVEVRGAGDASLAKYGRAVQVPSGVDAQVWAVQAFQAAYPNVGELESKIIEQKAGTSKNYVHLEVHRRSPQAFVPLEGALAVPVGTEKDGAKLTFYRCDTAVALFVDAGIWHGGPIAVGGDARFLVLLAKGTGESDTTKEPLEPPFLAEV